MKELIQLAEEKGFFGKLICNDQVYTQNKDYNEVSYVWMCELQKWLRDKYSLHINIAPSGDGETWSLYVFIWVDKKGFPENRPVDLEDEMFKPRFNSYEEGLNYSLKQALKLI